eukprot:1520013-Rhodomonas_salina.1
MSSTAGHGTDTVGAMSPDPRRPSRHSTGGQQPLFRLWPRTMEDPSVTQQELDKKTPRTRHG